MVRNTGRELKAGQGRIQGLLCHNGKQGSGTRPHLSAFHCDLSKWLPKRDQHAPVTFVAYQKVAAISNDGIRQVFFPADIQHLL